MKFNSLTIKNFKAIKETTLSLSNFNVIVGTNGSGKSSILQALHWVLQSGRNLEVKASSKKDEGSTLFLSYATYMPSPDYKNTSNGEVYGNFKNAKKLEINLKADDAKGTIESTMWLKAARNEGITIHIPSNNDISSHIRSKQREISAYIPGLAGIPLSEQKMSTSLITRQAAAGDANTVLRNFLLLLKEAPSFKEEYETKLKELEYWVSKILGSLSLDISFDDVKDYFIQASFKTGQMEKSKPLELAGIGFLQVIQIFAYLIYFQPRLLLVDEPDSHLHPDKQERLTTVLFEAAQHYDIQVIMTTHSPSVVRAIPSDSKLIWMKQGELVHDEKNARTQMGWGLLDKKVLLLSVDKNTDQLQKLINQWPEISRQVAIWPLTGITTLPKADSLCTMGSLFGGKLKIALHRDGDFMINDEKEKWEKDYKDKKINVWITEMSDIESYYCSHEFIKKTYGIEDAKADDLIKKAREKLNLTWEKSFKEKRKQVHQNKEIYPDGAGTPNHDDVVSKLTTNNPDAKYIGKKQLEKIREAAQEEKIPKAGSLGKYIPESIDLAPDLKSFLSKMLN